MFVPVSIFICFIASNCFTLVAAQDDYENDYCKVTEPIHGYTFNFTGLSKPSDDNRIRFNEFDSLRVHFCSPLTTPCNNNTNEEYAICLETKDGKKIGVGKEPPATSVKASRVIFKYEGDKCNETHNYTVVFEMKCDYTVEKGAVVDLDVVYDIRHDCHFHMVMATIAACPKRKLTKCYVYNETDTFNLNPLVKFADNYEVTINQTHSVLMNPCHSMIHGDHYPGCNTDSTVCLVDKTNQSSPIYKSIGGLKRETMLHILRDGSLENTYFTDQVCTLKHSSHLYKLSSTIHFVCDLDAHVSSPTYVGGLDGCNVKFFWKTSAACSEKILHDHLLKDRSFCSFKDPFDNNLKYDLTMLEGRSFKVREGNATYEFAVCSSLRNSPCRIGSGVCKTFDGKSFGLSGGIANGNLMWKEEGPYLNYTMGMSTANGTRKYTLITFYCGNEELAVEEFEDHTVIKWTTNMVCDRACATPDSKVNLQRLTRTSSNYILKVNYTEFHINVCNQLVPNNRLKCPVGVGICMGYINHMEPTQLVKPTNLGYPELRANQLSNGDVILMYRNGSRCYDSKDSNAQISSQITFKCDHTIDESSPEFKNYSDCTYYFEWKTRFSCGKVKTTVMDTECLLKNDLGDSWDLKVLRKTLVHYVLKGSKYGSYGISMCDRFRFCDGSYICYNKKFNYGRDITVITDYSDNLIQFQFNNGSTCKNGTLAHSVLTLKCSEWSNIGKPTLIDEHNCYAEFEWNTNAVCRPHQYSLTPPTYLDPTLDEDIDNEFRSKSILANKSASKVTAAAAVFSVLMLIGWFFNSNRRRHFFVTRIRSLFPRENPINITEVSEITETHAM